MILGGGVVVSHCVGVAIASEQALELCFHSAVGDQHRSLFEVAGSASWVGRGGLRFGVDGALEEDHR